MKKGVFISFEGIEGTGKSTQARLLAGYLEGRGVGVLLTAEPGGTELSRKIRELLLSVEHGGMDPLTELLLYEAARRQHVMEVIIPALEQGLAVITDRFSDSTRAYQGYGRGIDLELIESIDRAVTGLLRPDLTILLDIDVETGLKRNRAINKIDRIELEDIHFHERVREGYLALREAEPKRLRLVEAKGSPEGVHDAVIEAVKDSIGRLYPEIGEKL
jgi:dTMP kinase